MPDNIEKGKQDSTKVEKSARDPKDILNDIDEVGEKIKEVNLNANPNEKFENFSKRKSAYEKQLNNEGKMNHEDLVYKRYDLISELMKVDKELALEKFTMECHNIQSGSVARMKEASARLKAKEAGKKAAKK